jgi:hypothetical protein
LLQAIHSELQLRVWSPVLGDRRSPPWLDFGGLASPSLPASPGPSQRRGVQRQPRRGTVWPLPAASCRQRPRPGPPASGPSDPQAEGARRQPRVRRTASYRFVDRARHWPVGPKWQAGPPGSKWRCTSSLSFLFQESVIRGKGATSPALLGFGLVLCFS